MSERLWHLLSAKLDEIAAFYKVRPRITLIVRVPGKPNECAFLSDDSWADAVATVRDLHGDPTAFAAGPPEPVAAAPLAPPPADDGCEAGTLMDPAVRDEILTHLDDIADAKARSWAEASERLACIGCATPPPAPEAAKLSVRIRSEFAGVLGVVPEGASDGDLVGMMADALRLARMDHAPTGGGATPSLDALALEADLFARTTFPTRSAESISEHLRREAVELAANPHDPEEMADVFILLGNLVHYTGTDLNAAVVAKLAKNRARKWGKPDAQGVVEHVREDREACPIHRCGYSQHGCACEGACLACHPEPTAPPPAPHVAMCGDPDRIGCATPPPAPFDTAVPAPENDEGHWELGLRLQIARAKGELPSDETPDPAWAAWAQRLLDDATAYRERTGGAAVREAAERCRVRVEHATDTDWPCDQNSGCYGGMVADVAALLAALAAPAKDEVREAETVYCRVCAANPGEPCYHAYADDIAPYPHPERSVAAKLAARGGE